MSLIERTISIDNLDGTHGYTLFAVLDTTTSIYVDFNTVGAIGSIIDVDNTLEVLNFAVLDGGLNVGDHMKFCHASEPGYDVEFWWSDDVPKYTRIVREFDYVISSIDEKAI